jgi:hypothetical protein
MRRPKNLSIESVASKEIAQMALSFSNARRSKDVKVGEVIQALAIAFSSDGDIMGDYILEKALELAKSYTWQDRNEDAKDIHKRLSDALGL